MHRLLLLLGALVLSWSAVAGSAATHRVSVLDMQLAMKAALRAVLVCNEAGHQVGVSVVDRFGLEQVTLRSNMGGAHVTDAARRKAWTAATFNLPTSEIDALAQDEAREDLRTLSGVLALAGGLPIVSQSGELLGGIGVAGGEGTENEAKCAEAGLDAIAEQLK
ncbi:heme-binding protein [Roseibium porphyridii]|uniref:Heme-binding protein n=1 Tax=Roseibium porphyridii TaxID=2866279 RepID=A0ABY8F7R1_9HYPH|nr:heme-binding protein [Roseibium sp. KMA01]WFE91381.1 heme-binding protein [Roseibium sp. KMA01]